MSHRRFSFISCVSALNLCIFVLCGALTSNSSLKTNVWPSLYLEHSSYLFFFLTLSYLPNWGILIIQGLLNGRKSFHPELLVLSQFSASLVKLTSNCGIYLLGLLVEAPLESWGCSLSILCIILCFFANWLLLWSYRISSCYFTLEEGAQRRNWKPAGISLWFYWTHSGGWFLVFSCVEYCPFEGICA